MLGVHVVFVYSTISIYWAIKAIEESYRLGFTYMKTDSGNCQTTVREPNKRHRFCCLL